MDRIDPGKGTQPAIQLWTKLPFKVTGRIAFAHIIAVIHLHDLNLRKQRFFKLPQLLPVRLIQILIRICRIYVIHLCLGRRKISCYRKIVDPCKIIDLIGIFCRNFFGGILRSGIHDNDLIHQIRHRIQTACQHILFIFHDHT